MFNANNNISLKIPTCNLNKAYFEKNIEIFVGEGARIKFSHRDHFPQEYLKIRKILPHPAGYGSGLSNVFQSKISKEIFVFGTCNVLPYLLQKWYYTAYEEIRRDYGCFDVAGLDKIIVYSCHSQKGNQQWEYTEVISIKIK